MTRAPNNINFIATYLFHNPGAKYTEIIQSLCSWKNRIWSPGMYTCYLSDFSYGPHKGKYRDNLWKKKGPAGFGGGYFLTINGMARVRPDMNMESQHG